MLITPSLKKSLIVEQFQGNYLKPNNESFIDQAFSVKMAVEY